MSIQEEINKQKYYELLQWEIINHMMYANLVFGSFEEERIVYNPRPYQHAVYDSGLNNGYLFDLEPKEISNITSYYDVIVSSINASDNRALDNLAQFESDWHNCVFSMNELNVDEIQCQSFEKKFKIQRNFTQIN